MTSNIKNNLIASITEERNARENYYLVLQDNLDKLEKGSKRDEFSMGLKDFRIREIEPVISQIKKEIRIQELELETIKKLSDSIKPDIDSASVPAPADGGGAAPAAEQAGKTEKIIYIPENREEITTTRFPKQQDIELIRKSKIKNFEEDPEKDLTLKVFAYDLKEPTNTDTLKYQEGYMLRIVRNLIAFNQIFCQFKYSGKEEETYNQARKDYPSKEKKAKQELTNAKNAKNAKNPSSTTIEDATYNLEQLDIDLKNKKDRLDEYNKNPNALADRQFNKLVNVKTEQTVEDKKLYEYEILGFNLNEYNYIINFCINLRNEGIVNIDTSKKLEIGDKRNKFINK